MQRDIKRFIVTALSATLMTASSGVILAALGQEQPMPGGANVSMILFRIVSKDGKKFLETPTGEMLQVDKSKIGRDATTLAVYRDGANNVWYINKDGQPTPVPPQRVQQAIATIYAQREAKGMTTMPPPGAAPPQYGYPAPPAGYPYPYPPSSTTIIQEPSNNNNSNGAASMAVTGLAAAGGALAGAAIGDAMYAPYGGYHYNGVPYGTPIYHDGARGYYNNNGNKVYVNNEHNNNVMNQWNKQGNWDNRQAWSHPETTPTTNKEGWGGFNGGDFKGAANTARSDGFKGLGGGRFRGGGGRFRGR